MPFDNNRFRVSRRGAVRGLAAAGFGLTTLSALARRAAAAGQLEVLSWAGYDIPELAPAYYAANGSPNFSLMGSDEEGFQKVQAGFQPDLAHHTSYIVERMAQADMLQPIDPARLTNWDSFFPELREIGMFDGQNWIAPFSWGNVSVIYRPDLVGEVEQSWGILFDEAYAGKLAMRDDGPTAMVLTGIYMGVPDPHNMTEDEIQAAKELLIRQKPLLRFYWSGQTDLEQAMASGEVVAADGWNASVALLRAEGVDMAMMRPKEGILTWSDGLVYFKGSGAPDDLAYEFMNAYMAPEVGKFLIEAYGYASGNETVYPEIPVETLEMLGFNNPGQIMANSVFASGTPGAVIQRYSEVFEEVKAAS
jgi:spermidine/putrescine transport system substrate-binding protein